MRGCQLDLVVSHRRDKAAQYLLSVADGQRQCSHCQAEERAAQLSGEQREAIPLAFQQGGRLYAIKEARNLLKLSLWDATMLVVVLE